MKWQSIFVVVAINLTGCTSMVLTPQPSSVDSEQATQATTGVSALDKLIAKGDSQRRQGQYAQAAATLERALRLSPGSGAAYLALARVKLDQRHFREAQQLAEKSLSLAGQSLYTQRQAWLVISHAKRQQGDINGANHAAKRAREL